MDKMDFQESATVEELRHIAWLIEKQTAILARVLLEERMSPEAAKARFETIRMEMLDVPHPLTGLD